MNGRRSDARFTARPGDADRWIKAADAASGPREATSDAFTARITLDVTPAMRRQLKLAAIARELTVSNMLRGLLAREFPEQSGEGS